MRFLTSVVLVFAVFYTLFSDHAAAQTVPVTDTSRLLEFRGPLGSLACYVNGQELQVGRTSRPSGASPIQLEVRTRSWVTRQLTISRPNRDIAEIKAALRRATGSRRTTLLARLKRANVLLKRAKIQWRSVLGPPCQDLFNRATGVATPTPLPTATPNPNQGQELNELRENLFGAQELDPQALAALPPGLNTRLVFVDSIDGDDSMNGFTEDDAFRTVTRAITYLNSIATYGGVDAHVYLRRGGSYQLEGLTVGGIDSDSPLVFAAYGDPEAARPRVAPIQLGGPVKNLALSDLLFEAATPGSGTAITVTGSVEKLLIQNCVIRNFRNGIVVQSNTPADEISIYRNIITDLWSAAEPSYGVKLHNITRAIISSNVLDHIGQRSNAEFVPNELSTAIAVSATRDGATVRGNQILRSPTGIVIASDSSIALGHLYSNALVQVGIAGTLVARAVYLEDNIVIEGTDIGELNRGWGFHVRNASAIQAFRNYVANTISSTVASDFAMKFTGEADFGLYDISSLHVYNASDVHMGGFLLDSNSPSFSLALKDSTIQNTRAEGAQQPLITLQGRPDSVVRTQFRRLRLHNPLDSSQRLYRIVEEGSIFDVSELGWWSWFSWHCSGTSLRVTPNLRMQSNNWYNGFEIHQGSVVHTVDDHDNPNRFEFDECVRGYHSGPYTAEQRVTRDKWDQYANDEGSVITETEYLDPHRNVIKMLEVNNVPGTTIDDYVDYLAGMDRGTFDFRFVGQRLSQWLRVGFNPR